ncbi:MAG: hypothetical protein HQL39_01405 [Alphaproteobacteria bacterium]|nr:hypothetical protein [Alphaproteobacteria bacterium]
MPHVELCARFASEWPEAQQIMYQALNINLAEVAEMLDWCTGFETPVRFSAERSAFVLTLIKARHAALTGALGNALD